jgi:hypothetical protein
MEVKTLRCDECGKLRVNDSNNWMEGVRFAEGFVSVGRVGTLPVDPAKVSHFCGQGCAMKWVAVKIGEL